jgi:hypothetical protein
LYFSAQIFKTSSNEIGRSDNSGNNLPIFLAPNPLTPGTLSEASPKSVL